LGGRAHLGEVAAVFGGEGDEEVLRLSAPLPPEFRRTMEALGMEWSFDELPRDLWD
jgi:hypothetical protein